MELEHEAVLHAHGRHLDEELAPEPLGIAGLGLPLAHPAEQVLGLTRGEVHRDRRRVAVVRGRRAGGDEGLAPGPQRGEVARPRRGVLTGQLGQAAEVVLEVRPVGVDDVVGPERGHDPAVPAARRDRGVGVEGVEGAVGRGQELDAEALVEGPGPEGVGRQRLDEVVVGGVGRGRRERLGDAEDLRQRVVEPQLRRRRPEEGVVLGERAPGAAPVGDLGAEPSRGTTPSASSGTPWL